ncbi:60 kDa lysophospholipase isoform X2 [Erythrolamprus reginae]|uniref:60 kDa lysophospholipase isoform X2 n=1 Tax=Erythrolamprus reginae TaxID=121349 RepID=UPI00396C4BFA
MTEGEKDKLGRALSCTTLDAGRRTMTEVWVLVINTGGTIGMVRQSEGLVPEANKLAEALKKVSIFHDATYAKENQLYNRFGIDALVLPSSKQNIRIIYTIVELSPLLDSSNMTPSEWDKIAECLEANYEKYDGFVILHGTDTMAYTSSALSFMCENLGKTVILTGSQIPIYELRNDGRANLLGALLIAGQFVIPEVCLYFDNKLYRGNRVTKMDAGSFNAFSSPNLPPLANTDVDIIINWETIWRPDAMKKFETQKNMNSNVGLLKLFPGITATAVRAFLQSSMEGVVLETYGSGNAPNNCPELLDLLRKATDSNVMILNCTQCLRGSVSLVYATGKSLMDLGVIPGGDMTPEAALAKLSYVLSKPGLTFDEKKKMLSKNLRGEMTVVPIGIQITLKGCKFMQEIAKYLSIGCKEELATVRDVLTPSLACMAAKNDDLTALKILQDLGGNLSSGDYDGRTPLHVASCEGNLKVVRHLLKSGATVYAKDRLGATPLMNAVTFRNKKVIELLRGSGAHLSSQELVNVGTELCSLAFHGDLDGLLAWHLAGADLNQTGYDGNTPANVAMAAGHAEVIEFLNKLAS